MSTDSHAPRGSLKRDHLSFLDVVAQAIGIIAPSGTPAFVFLGVFATAGNALWLGYLFATLALLLLSFNITAFSRRSASPGALYTFAGQGLGAFWGSITGWALVIAYLFTAGAVVAGGVNYALVVLHSVFGPFADRIASVAIAAVLVAIAFYVAWRSIKLSTRLTLTLEAVTVIAILAISILWLVRAPNPVDTAQLRLDGVTADQVRLGLVLAFFSFVGFEGATVLGHEAKNPLRVIPRAVIVTVLSVGLFFVFTGYVLVASFQGAATGLDKVDAPLSVLATTVGLEPLGLLIAAGVAASFFASALGSINAGARIIYSLSRHGIIFNRAGDAHETHATPHVAVAISAAIAALLALPLIAAGIGLLDVFAYLGTIATLGFLTTYILVAIAAPVFLWSRGELRFHHVLVSVLSILLLTLPVLGVLYPVPDYPLNILPYVFLGLLLIGALQFIVLRWRSPAVLEVIQKDLADAAAPAAAAE
ncbi:APC family permease [Rhodomicrobium lacus]|uniref:APC family permease n=1 Tax=Rhodomicrobium lacus TaxID=2498452 RepID=UPI000F8E413E|nr:APC family permease [Rhodomicrobium lacus]